MKAIVSPAKHANNVIRTLWPIYGRINGTASVVRHTTKQREAGYMPTAAAAAAGLRCGTPDV